LPIELYELPRPQISQGDILEVLPHTSLEHPLVSLQKERETESVFRAVGEPYDNFNDKEGQTVVASCKRSKAILISHDCEIDKSHVKKWLVCPVVPMGRLQPKNQDLLKRNRIFSMLFLPKFEKTLDDSFVDFNQLTTLDSEFVRSAKRIISLSDIGRRALYIQFIRWLARWELREIVCPNCQTRFDPHASQSVRST
jgi:hypothetical protein